MNVPCIVELDLNRHLHQMDWRDAQDDRAQEFQEERRRYLLEDRPGLSLVTEALSMDEPGYPLDESLFALLEAWRLGSSVMDAAGHLVVLVREQAERMARQWAGRAVAREIESAQDDDEDLPW
jgi:hypothetical protein